MFNWPITITVGERRRKDGYQVSVHQHCDLALSATMPKHKANALALRAADHFTRNPHDHVSELHNLV